ncbi:MAG: hypothetical protein V2A76_04945 [Planctomycetota bacterium]
MKIVTFTVLAAAILASAATAQQPPPAKKVTGVRSFQIGAAHPKSTTSVVYSNTLWSGWYMRAGAGWEWIDWGSARDLTPLAEHGTITHGSFAYATSAAVGPAIRWRIYDGYAGWCTPQNPGGLDLSLTGLPGSVSTTATAWIVGIDLAAAGLCFYLPTGPFGYSYSFSDSNAGPLLASGDSAQNMFDGIDSTGSCATYWFGCCSPWCGFYTEFNGWKTSDTFGAGCNGPISLGVTGNSCPGGVLNLSLAGPGPDATPFSAVALGLAVGTGVGGPLSGGCFWDVGLAPGVPPASAIFGPLPVVLSFGATIPAGAAAGTILGAQWVQKDRITGILSTSNVVEIFVP